MNAKNHMTRFLCGTLSALLLSTTIAFAAEVPVSQTEQNVDGKQILTKVFEVEPSVDPETLKEDGLEQNGFVYHLSSFTKEVYEIENRKEAVQEQTLELKSQKEQDAYIEALKILPQTLEYAQDGYEGTLYLQTGTIEIAETGRTTHTGTNKITKNYTVEYNDDSLIPETAAQNGTTYNLSTISWSEGSYGEDETLPDNYVATATYTKGYSYSTVDGYVTTASYRGTVEATENTRIRYTAEYVGSIPMTRMEKFQAGTTAAVKALFILALGVAALLFILLVLWKGVKAIREKIREKREETHPAQEDLQDPNGAI